MHAKRWVAAGMTVLLAVVLIWSGCSPPPVRDGTWSWNLGVQTVLERSGSVAITDLPGHRLSLDVRQLNVGSGLIRYSLIGTAESGDEEVLASALLAGDVREGKRITFRELPDRAGYRLQVYNYGSCLCQGTVSIHPESE